MSVRLILGSASPRRLELLARIGVRPDGIRAPHIDETPERDEYPRPYCRRIARKKAAAVALGAGEIVLTADTCAAIGRRILGKPEGRDQAAKFLHRLSGRRHRVITAVALRSAARLWERESMTTLRFKRLTEAEIRAYLDSNEWRGKAGGYAIQGRAAAFIPWIEGSFSGVVGLPLAETATLLHAAGYRMGER